MNWKKNKYYIIGCGVYLIMVYLGGYLGGTYPEFFFTKEKAMFLSENPTIKPIYVGLFPLILPVFSIYVMFIRNKKWGAKLFALISILGISSLLRQELFSFTGYAIQGSGVVYSLILTYFLLFKKEYLNSKNPLEIK